MAGPILFYSFLISQMRMNKSFLQFLFLVTYPGSSFLHLPSIHGSGFLNAELCLSREED